MNKKFSTLVASLLLTSAFSVYSVDAKPMLATPTQVETRATLPAEVEDAVEFPNALPNFSGTATDEGRKVLPGFMNNARIFLAGYATNPNATDDVRFLTFTSNEVKPASYSFASKKDFYWSYIGGQLVNNAGQDFTVAGISEYMEIVPLTKSGESTPFFAIATRANGGDIQYVQYNAISQAFELGTSVSSYDAAALANAAIFCTIEAEYNTELAGGNLNKELGGGFNLSISSLIDETATVIDADVFAGKLTAYDSNTNAVSLDETTTSPDWYYLKNAAGKYIVFEKDSRYTSDGIADEGHFKLVDNIDFTTQKAFFQVYKSDNDSEDVIVRVADTKRGSNIRRFYIANTRGTFALSIANEGGTYTPALDAKNWAITSLSVNNYVNLKKFLDYKFVTVEFVKAAKEDATNKYKKDGILAVKANGTGYKADFVAKSGVYEKAPEAQWAVSTTDNGQTIWLKNRENIGAAIQINALRESGQDYEVVLSSDNAVLTVGDIVKIQFVEDHGKHDGYAVFNANDLRNETYHLGQVRQAEGEDINVYWAENHVASHQIGATVEEANASRWNLELVNKAIVDHTTEVDSVLVESTLQYWNPTKNRVESKKDTLVILPYAFQNRSNNEYVKLNNELNLDYYICDKDNKDDATKAQRFALKMKADGTYNYIALENNVYDKGAVKANAGFTIVKKVYQENSTDRGTWKEMGAYDGDANALMFVAPVEAPEYRKLVTTANLDTIKLYRADNEAQVVYEKKDPKSIVEGDTLSFLNIDNDAQFTTINPALYADTAYVNRGDNTCWQYLLGVNIVHHEGYYCKEHGFNVTPPCEHAKPVSYNQGRYLMNMIDTANVYAQTVGIHNNPYINENEENAQCAKLMFVDAIHVLTDSINMDMADKLYIITENAEGREDYAPIALNDPALNTVKFAFKYVDYMENQEEFKIQTQWKQYGGTAADNEGYLRWVNGCIVVDDAYQKGDVFNMNEDETRTPTANGEISAEEATVSVVATDGAVIVKGAEGKNVIVSTILGKVVANEVVNSDNETIAAPAGIVVVSVDGESFKVAVK